MVVEIIITEQIWCDPHHKLHDQKVPATHVDVVVAFGGAKPRRLDMCDECYDRYIGELPDVVIKCGAVVQKGKPGPKSGPQRVAAKARPKDGPTRTRAKEDPQPCPVPGCTTVAETGGGLSAHLRGHTPAEQKKARAELAKRTKSFRTHEEISA
jgi:hypothetical protein